MKRRQASDTQGAIWLRIAFRLISMAVAAERAAAAPEALRQYVIWTLRQAEFALLVSVADIGHERAPLMGDYFEAFLDQRFGAENDENFHYDPDDGVDGALRLALTFRSLAAIFYMLAHHAEGDAPEIAGIYYQPWKQAAAWPNDIGRNVYLMPRYRPSAINCPTSSRGPPAAMSGPSR